MPRVWSQFGFWILKSGCHINVRFSVTMLPNFSSNLSHFVTATLRLNRSEEDQAVLDAVIDLLFKISMRGNRYLLSQLLSPNITRFVFQFYMSNIQFPWSRWIIGQIPLESHLWWLWVSSFEKPVLANPPRLFWLGDALTSWGIYLMYITSQYLSGFCFIYRWLDAHSAKLRVGEAFPWLLYSVLRSLGFLDERGNESSFRTRRANHCFPFRCSLARISCKSNEFFFDYGITVGSLSRAGSSHRVAILEEQLFSKFLILSL